MILTANEIATLVYFSRGFGPKGDSVITKPLARQFVATAVAVALAESSGNTEARNRSSSASGLWQILAKTHSARIAKTVKDSGDAFKPDARTIFNPIINTAVAKQLYLERGNWTAWEAWNTGAYKRHMAKGFAAYDNVVANPQVLKATRDKLYRVYYRPEVIPLVTNFDPADYGANMEGDGLGGFFDDRKDDATRAAVDAGNAIQELNPVPKILGFIRASALPVGVFLLGAILVILGVWFTIRNTAPAKATAKVVTKGLV